MSRKPNTTVRGLPFDPATIRAVWNKGEIIFGWDSTHWRRDAFGHTIRFEDFGNEESVYGWHIDHTIPVTARGHDGLTNLAPLYWKTNMIKSDLYPYQGGGISAQPYLSR
jgi:hypothetical protein